MAEALHRTISDNLLDIAVRIKREAGVGPAELQAVIARFAAQERFEQRTGGIGFPLVEDIPQDRRGDFLAALAELAPAAGRREAALGEPASNELVRRHG